MKRVYIMQAIPGAGKSTLVSAIKAGYESQGLSVSVCSADHYMIKDGVYCFEGRKLKENHERNQKRFEEKLMIGTNVVICDNTNIDARWAAPYIKMAKQYGYSIRVIRIYCDVEEAISINSHDCPESTIRSMNNRMENLI